MSNIEGAIHWWLCENCKKNKEAFGEIRSLLTHFYYCANSLYSVRSFFPQPNSSNFIGKNKFGISSGNKGIYIINNLEPLEFFKLRGILALIGDLVITIRQIDKLSEKLDNNILPKLIKSHLPNLEKYQDARNYFTHFDERIGKGIEKHGVTGELIVTELGLEYTKEAKGCFYLGFIGDTIYYHDKREMGPNKEEYPSPKSLSLNKNNVSEIFDLVKDMYDLFTSHSIQKEEYPLSSLVYDLS